MSAYVVIEITPSDLERFEEYEAGAVAGYFGTADYTPWRELRHANAETSALAISDDSVA